MIFKYQILLSNTEISVVDQQNIVSLHDDCLILLSWCEKFECEKRQNKDFLVFHARLFRHFVTSTKGQQLRNDMKAEQQNIIVL